MAKQTINIGSTPSDGSGDSLRTAFRKTNENTTELYGALGNAVSVDELEEHTEDTSNPHGVTKSQVGLGNVDNVSDALKPISTATQAALNAKAATSALTAETNARIAADALKADLASPALTGNPTAPTQASGNNSERLANTAFVKAAIDDLIADAPDALNTLKEISDQLAVDGDAVSALTVTVASKAPAIRTVNGHALTADVAVTKGDVGLGNADNTSDASKPVSTTQQAALNLKQDRSSLGADSAAAVHAATAKTTPVDADEFGCSDSAASYGLKKLTWANLKATLKTYFDTLYAGLTHAARHKSGGADAIKLDELAAPTDVATLNATTSAHGLLPKLGGGTANFLRADGTWAAAGGGSINLPLRAWVENTGNDVTAAVGDPGKPFQTMLAAYTAGARMMHLGIGAFAGITKTGSIDLSYIGCGQDVTSIGTIATTSGGAVLLRDMGNKSAAIGSIAYSYAAYTAQDGQHAGALGLYNVVVSGNVTARGETGANGIDGLSPNAGNGGNSAFLSGANIQINGNCDLSGAAGGIPYDSGFDPANGGNGGQGGNVSVTGVLRVFGSLISNGQAGQAGLYGGSDGSAQGGGAVDVDDLYVGSTLSLIAGGEYAYPGNLTARKAVIQNADFSGSAGNLGTITGVNIVITNLVNFSAPDASTVLLSSINGV